MPQAKKKRRILEENYRQRNSVMCFYSGRLSCGVLYESSCLSLDAFVQIR